jgi:hypothetical protein
VKRFVSIQFLKSKTFGRTAWTSDQPVARPIRNTNRINTDIYTLSGIRIHDLSVRASEDSSGAAAVFGFPTGYRLSNTS